MIWEYIVLHHSLTADSDTVSWGAIRRYHTDPNGAYKMTDIGYHWGVELVNGYYEILVGRTLTEAGAHCKEGNMNRRGIGVCLIGNFDAVPPPTTQVERAVRLVSWLMAEFRIPRERIIGHRDAGLLAGADWRKGEYKSCPGAQFDLDYFRGFLPPFLT